MRIKFVSCKTVGAAFGLMLATGLLLAAQQVAVEPLPASSPAPPLGTPDSVKAEDYYKNIQVLKGIPANQIVPTMEYMRSALGGVRCQYCHEAPPDFEKDTKPQKETGRKMLEMVMAINKSTFNGRVQVTCYTCHRGSTDPVNVPAIPAPTEAANPAAPAAKPPALPTVETILSKYVDALGGEQAIRKVTSRVVTGTMDVSEVGGATGSPELKPSFELYEKAPNLTVLFSRDPKWPSAEGYDGTTAWTQDAGGRVAAASGAALARAKGSRRFLRGPRPKARLPDHGGSWHREGWRSRCLPRHGQTAGRAIRGAFLRYADWLALAQDIRRPQSDWQRSDQYRLQRLSSHAQRREISLHDPEL